ncbi:P-loop containing nucleoside triphosphate hydrolase protein [Trametes punicea]|nr:P-loop containing nucleoside triphosphate hydrolase protein [Trametes punicea]
MLSTPTTLSPPAEPGISSRALLVETNYTKTSQELIRFITTLRSLGAQVYLDLPRIVVIGNQSAGKSSLVEAISGISVPRDAGTCTRCPMECRLAHSADEWSCQISVRWEFDDNGDRLEEVREVQFGPRLTDKTQVEPLLRRAQAAVLSGSVSDADSPDMWHQDTKKGKAATKVLAFSRNTICVDLAGPDLVDLSFVDLPGIVQNAEDAIVKLVEDLVTSYVGGNCLILVALPMSDDIENQKAARIAKEADPFGLRTIGVLTKPDTLPPGSTKRRELWLDVLEGREHPLQHGYYCTRQPDDDQRLAGITPAEARAAETEFFRTTSPWNTATCPHRFGTSNLVKSISELLTNIISDSLPKLLAEVASQLESTNKQLDALPPRITTKPSAFVLDLVTKFSNDVVQLVHGSPQYTKLVQSDCDAYKHFRDGILSTAPSFAPFEKKQWEKKVKGQLRMKQVKIDDVAQSTRVQGTKLIYLDEVREHIRAAVTRELPNNIPYPAKRSLIQEFQKSWAMHTMACFERVQTNFKTHLVELIRSRFERFNHLKGAISPSVMEQVALCSGKTADHLKTILKLESAAPFTQNVHYFKAKREKHLATYKQARANRPRPGSSTRHADDYDTESGAEEWAVEGGLGEGAKEDFSFSMPRPSTMLSQKDKDSLRNALAELTKLGYQVTEDDLGKLNKSDEYEEEMEVMAEVRAYFAVSYKRIIDYVPLSIDQHLLYELAENLQGVLIGKLGLGSAQADARCATYVAEDPHVVALRQELMAKKSKLETVQRELFNFGL